VTAKTVSDTDINCAGWGIVKVAAVHAPVDADGGQVEYGSSARSHVQCHPRVT